MIRKIVEIDREKCNGCGLCANACHEGAIAMVDGKAQLLRDDYCDGLGACLPACPVDAIRIIEREAAEYDQAAVDAHLQTRGKGCPGTRAQTLVQPISCDCPGFPEQTIGHGNACCTTAAPLPSELRQWPVQIQLVSPMAPYFDGADLLVAADCAAYSYGDFHRDFIRGRVTLIGCPKLDPVNYAEKLTAILRMHDVRSITLARMEVPCCGGLERAVRTALEQSGKQIPLQVTTLSIRGDIL